MPISAVKANPLDLFLNRLSPYTFAFLSVGIVWYATMQFSLDRARRRWRQRYREAAARREEAESANKAKAFFLTSMSHEVRAPLNAIIGFTDLALKTQLSPELRAYLGTIRASADWLNHVANEILEYARMEGGKLTLAGEWFSLRDTLRSAVDIAAPFAKQKSLLLRLHLDPSLPSRVQGDSTRLLQVLFNLIENAIKFTTAGSVLVTAKVETRTPDKIACRLSVADTGIGMSEKRLRRLFEPLAEPAESLDRRSRTVGFGLPICQKLVHMMGGNIEVQSRPGMGSTFTFSLTFDTKQTEAIEVSAPVEEKTDLVTEAATEALTAASAALNKPSLPLPKTGLLSLNLTAPATPQSSI